jgi:hypothetical protein
MSRRQRELEGQRQRPTLLAWPGGSGGTQQTCALLPTRVRPTCTLIAAGGAAREWAARSLASMLSK